MALSETAHFSVLRVCGIFGFTMTLRKIKRILIYSTFFPFLGKSYIRSEKPQLHEVYKISCLMNKWIYYSRCWEAHFIIPYPWNKVFEMWDEIFSSCFTKVRQTKKNICTLS